MKRESSNMLIVHRKRGKGGVKDDNLLAVTCIPISLCLLGGVLKTMFPTFLLRFHTHTSQTTKSKFNSIAHYKL